MAKQKEIALTKKQQIIKRKDQVQRRYVLIGIGAVFVLIVGILGFGLAQQFMVEPASPVAIVNGETIRTDYYQARVRLSRFLLDEQMTRISAQRKEMLASLGNSELANMFSQQYDQYLGQLQQQRISVARDTYDRLVNDAIIRKYAVEYKIVVSDDELQERIRQIVSLRQGAVTATIVKENATAQAEATATAALWTPTPTLAPSPTPTVTKTMTATATATEMAPAATPTTPEPTPTPNILTEDKYNQAKGEWFKTLMDKAQVNETQFKDCVYNSLIEQKVQKELAKTVAPIADQVRARHILVENEDEAKKVVERLSAGEDFAKVAKEVSKDTSSAARGGELDWAPPDQYVPEFADALRTLPIGKISQPVKTQFGWHVIEVLERANRELTSSLLSQLQQQAYSQWLQKAKSEAKIQDFWSQNKVPADPELDRILKMTPPA